MTNVQDLIGKASKVGAWAAQLESVDENRGANDQIHHLGDDTGDLITQAYREFGADAAAQVIEAYLASFNSARSKAGVRRITDEEAIAHLEWAIRPQGISEEEQRQVRFAFNNRISLH